MEEPLSNAAMAVLAHHRDHAGVFGHAAHMIGHYKGIQTLEDLERIYEVLEDQGYVEASTNECANYVDADTGQKIFRTKFRHKVS